MPEYLKKGDEISANKFGLGTFVVRLEMPTNFIDDINKMYDDVHMRIIISRGLRSTPYQSEKVVISNPSIIR